MRKGMLRPLFAAGLLKYCAGVVPARLQAPYCQSWGLPGYCAGVATSRCTRRVPELRTSRGIVLAWLPHAINTNTAEVEA